VRKQDVGQCRAIHLRVLVRRGSGIEKRSGKKVINLLIKFENRHQNHVGDFDDGNDKTTFGPNICFQSEFPSNLSCAETLMAIAKSCIRMKWLWVFVMFIGSQFVGFEWPSNQQIDVGFFMAFCINAS
jgi:hypothetical protein